MGRPRREARRNHGLLPDRPVELLSGPSPPAFTLGWRPREGHGLQQQAGFDHIADLDVFEDRLLVLAVRRDEKRRLAPDGAIAWLGSLRQGLAYLRPVLYDRTGPGAKRASSPTPVELSKWAPSLPPRRQFFDRAWSSARDELYGANGRLLRSWSTGSLGLDTADCAGLTEREISRLAIDPFARMPWLNQRHVVDEILLLKAHPRRSARWMPGAPSGAWCN